MAVTDPDAAKPANGISAFVKHKEDPGFEVGSKERKLDIKGAPESCQLLPPVEVSWCPFQHERLPCLVLSFPLLYSSYLSLLLSHPPLPPGQQRQN